jgi:hypothetical protein
MNRTFITAAIATAAALASFASLAGETEVLAARQNGELLVAGELGVAARDAFPANYPAAVTATHTQVRTEADRSVLQGPVTGRGEIGVLDASPARSTSTKSRAEMRAEVIQARRAGDLLTDGELGVKAKDAFPTVYRKAI